MSWTAPAFINALKERFENWEGLEGVDIYAAPVEKPPTSGDAIVFVRAPGNQDWAVLGAQQREDNYTLECVLVSIANGLGEANATIARDRTGELMSEVSDCLLHLVAEEIFDLAEEIGAQQIMPFRMSGISLDLQTAESGRRACQVNFNIEVTALV